MKLRRLLEMLSDTALHHNEAPVKITLGPKSYLEVYDELAQWAPGRMHLPEDASKLEFSFENVIIAGEDPAP